MTVRYPGDSKAPVFMYTTTWCPFCMRARDLLKRKGVEFDDLNLDEHPEMRGEMITLSGRRTVPQIWVGGQHVGGSDDLHALDAAGRLDAMIDAARRGAAASS